VSRQIIILENQVPNRLASDPLSYRYAFWLAVPLTRQLQYARLQATVVSQVPSATAAETTAIQTGTVKEEVNVFSAPAGSTLAQIEAGLQVQFAARQTALNSSAENPWDHFNSSFDGTSWTIVTVA